MKSTKPLLAFLLVSSLLTSCTVETIVEEPSISLRQLLSSQDLWYVDIDQTLGYGQTPFLQLAFTLSFKNGALYANNNLVGFGPNGTGNGYGVQVGSYDAYDMVLDIFHDLDGQQRFEVYQTNANTIELYNPRNDTSYFLHGYRKNQFDYDRVFYENIHYFLQEYAAWEKSYVSKKGALNAFDHENYLQFLAGGNDSEFRSSKDPVGLKLNRIYWDYTGLYQIKNIKGNAYLKTLTLDYDYFDNESFELSVINDQLIRLYHRRSGTTYEFTGRGFMEFRRGEIAQKGDVEMTRLDTPKWRTQKSSRQDNPRNPRG